MDQKDFGPTRTGHFVPTLMGHVAFVPNKLAGLDLKLTWSEINLLTEASAAVAEVSGACSKHINPLLVLRPFQRREAILSSRIEGTITSAKELATLEVQNSPTSGPVTETQEVQNYLNALDAGIKRLQSLPISLRLIRELHGILMDGVRCEDSRPGEFRQHQAAIGKKGQSEKEARFVPPPPHDMLQCLDDFEKFLHLDRFPTLIKMAIAHYQFETIHPFGDGNGRTGRLLIPLLLLADKKMDRSFLYLSPYLEANDEVYRDHLLAISQNGTWNSWIQFFLTGVISQSRDTIKRLEKLMLIYADFRARVTKAPGALQGIVDDLFSVPAITAEKIADKYKVSHQTAMNYVRKLQGKGILDEQQKVGRQIMYFAMTLVRMSG